MSINLATIDLSLPRYVSVADSNSEYYDHPPASAIPGQDNLPPKAVTIRNYFGSTRRTTLGPQGFLVDDHPEFPTIRAHFHPVDQFQVFFAQRGAWYKSHEIDGIVVHYADAYVTYGPFGTKGLPFSFFTLRADGNEEVYWMPESRDQLPPPPRPRHRNIHVDVETNAELEAAIETLELRPLIEQQSDGLAAHLAVIPPHQTAIDGSTSQAPGRYHCVVSGDIVHEGHTFGPRSLGWLPADSALPVTAGERGAKVLILQFPRSAPN
jgi:hypothetical protein